MVNLSQFFPVILTPKQILAWIFFWWFFGWNWSTRQHQLSGQFV